MEKSSYCSFLQDKVFVILPDGNIATEKYIISQFKKTVKKISDEEILLYNLNFDEYNGKNLQEKIKNFLKKVVADIPQILNMSCDENKLKKLIEYDAKGKPIVKYTRYFDQVSYNDSLQKRQEEWQQAFQKQEQEFKQQFQERELEIQKLEQQLQTSITFFNEVLVSYQESMNNIKKYTEEANACAIATMDFFKKSSIIQATKTTKKSTKTTKKAKTTTKKTEKKEIELKVAEQKIKIAEPSKDIAEAMKCIENAYFKIVEQTGVSGLFIWELREKTKLEKEIFDKAISQLRLSKKFALMNGEPIYEKGSENNYYDAENKKWFNYIMYINRSFQGGI